MSVLLHACCGPCLLEPFDALSASAEVTVCYANPNIHPREEYRRRRDTMLQYAEERGINVIELPYDPALWDEAVSAATSKAERCRACYRLRIGLVAAEAVRKGFDAVSTTLSVSPWQDQKAIREEGEAVCAAVGVRFIYEDFRERYPEATRRSRELGMYRQNYCGCGPSMAEAEAERAARREARAAEKAARQRR